MEPWMSCLDREPIHPPPGGRLPPRLRRLGAAERDAGKTPLLTRGWQGEALTGVGRCRDGPGTAPLPALRVHLPPGEGSLRQGCLLVLRFRYIPICCSIFSFRDEFSSLNDFIGCRKCNGDSRVAFRVSKVIRYVHNPHTVCHCSGLDPNRYLFIQFDRGLLANSCSADSG